VTDWESTSAWRELLDGLAGFDAAFLTGDRAVTEGRTVAEGYRMMGMLLGVALDTYLYADPSRPVFVDVNTPFRRDRRWGGDNTDAYYCLAPIDPARSYRVSGRPGDSAYFSLTVYNEPSPGAWSDRVIGVLRDSDLEVGADGTFELVVGPARPEGYAGAFIELAEDAAVLMTRDYQVDPFTGRRVEWAIEALEPPGPIPHGDAETAVGLRSALTWLRTMFAIVPLSVGVRSDAEHLSGHDVAGSANTFADPYQVPDANFGWSAVDACYSFGSFDLGPDEALVVTHRPPDCRFWNLVVWNPYMGTHNAGDGPTSVNHGTAVPNSDGTVTVVIARTLGNHPNAVTTLDDPRGNLAFRWFLADEVPAPPEVRLVKLADAPGSVT
jgi:hypothetical protein